MLPIKIRIYGILLKYKIQNKLLIMTTAVTKEIIHQLIKSDEILVLKSVNT